MQGQQTSTAARAQTNNRATHNGARERASKPAGRQTSNQTHCSSMDKEMQHGLSNLPDGTQGVWYCIDFSPLAPILLNVKPLWPSCLAQACRNLTLLKPGSKSSPIRAAVRGWRG